MKTTSPLRCPEPQLRGKVQGAGLPFHPPSSLQALMSATGTAGSQDIKQIGWLTEQVPAGLNLSFPPFSWS